MCANSLTDLINRNGEKTSLTGGGVMGTAGVGKPPHNGCWCGDDVRMPYSTWAGIVAMLTMLNSVNVACMIVLRRFRSVTLTCG
jgi:hypothetical protein